MFSPMLILLNHTPETLPGDQLTIREILKIKNFTFPNLVIKINSKVIRKADWDEYRVTEGDQVEIIHLISGG